MATASKAAATAIRAVHFRPPIPHHVIEFCLTVRNRANGFYANHHLDGQVWFNNTAYRNSVNYNMLCSTNNTSSAGDVPGFNQVMKNNLGYKANRPKSPISITNAIDITFNYFTLPVTVCVERFYDARRQACSPLRARPTATCLTSILRG